MKKNIMFIIFLFLFLYNTTSVLALDYAKKEEVDKKVDAEYYCYYNSSGLPEDNYNVIVGISSNKEEVYSDIGGSAGTEPILNWIYNDKNWDTDLDASFSAYNYYMTEGKCPEMAYIHYFPISYNLYLINGNQIEDLINTFQYTAALDNEEKYLLVDFNADTTVEKSCSYSVDVKETTAATENNKKINFNLDFNNSGKIINAANIADRVSLAPEISLNYNYVGDSCPNLYICHVVGKSLSSNRGNDVFEYKYELYFSDYTSIYERKNCYKISCTNTNGSYCNSDSSDADICPNFSSLYVDVANNYNSNNLDLYNTSKLKIISYCRALLSNLNADNPCVTQCLGLNEKIQKLENKTPSTPVCGFSNRLLTWIKNIMKWIKYILPVLVIVLSILDFIKAIGADKDDEMKKAQGKFTKRLIAAALAFLIPLIIEFVLGVMGFDSNGCGIIDL